MKQFAILILAFAASLALAEDPHPGPAAPRPNWAPSDFHPRSETDPGLAKGPDHPAVTVNWRAWNAATFAEADRAGKPILLFVSAPWLHVGHAMERTTLSDPGVVKLLNEYFIPVKLNRDERPDVDLRLQQAVKAISGARGWPLTVCLTPDGRAFFGGTSYTADDDFASERPGLRATLIWLATLWRDNRDQVYDRADAVEKLFKVGYESEKLQGQIPPAAVHQLALAMRDAFDERSGGSKLEPTRFPAPRALDACLIDYGRTHDKDTLKLVTASVNAMLRGALYDRLSGGFHRCCLDRWWRVPRFEKMLVDNAEIATLLLHAYQASGDERCREALTRTLEFWDAPPMFTPAGKSATPFGWSASQASGINSADDGDYFTWTVKEAEAALRDDADCKLACAFYQIGEIGGLPQTAPERNVLFEAMTLAEAAKQAGIGEDEARKRLERVHAALLAARNARPAPPVDTAIYVDGNALMAAAHIECGRVLNRKDWIARGEEVLNQLILRGIEAAKGGSRAVHSVVRASAPAQSSFTGTEARSTGTGLLQDEAALFYACTVAFEATGNDAFASRASDSFERLNQNFWEPVNGGHLDRIPGANTEPAASLPWNIKPYMDTTEPSSNGLIALGCVRMYALTGRKEYRERAAATIEAFAAPLVKLGVYSATLAAAGEALVNGCMLISIDRGPAATDAAADALADAAVSAYAPWKFVIEPRIKNPMTQARVARGLSAWDSMTIGGGGGVDVKTAATPAELKKIMGE